MIRSSREWVMVRTGREGLGPGVFHWPMRGRCIDIGELRMRSGSAGEGVCCGARWPVGAVQCCCRVRLRPSRVPARRGSESPLLTWSPVISVTLA